RSEPPPRGRGARQRPEGEEEVLAQKPARRRERGNDLQKEQNREEAARPAQDTASGESFRSPARTHPGAGAFATPQDQPQRAEQGGQGGRQQDPPWVHAAALTA